MKKLFLFCIYILVSFAVTAQNSFCIAIKEIEANAVNNFSSVCNFTNKVSFYNKGRKSIGDGYKTSLTLPGFTFCFIGSLGSKEFYDPPYFYAEIEDFNSEAPGMAGIEELKNKLASCLANYSIEKDPSHHDVGYFRDLYSDIIINYRFFQKKQNSDILPRFFLRLERSKSNGSIIYTISIFVPGTGKEDPVKIAQKESIVTKKIQEQTPVNLNDNSSTCERLAYLFNHWQSGWDRMPKTLKQEEDDEGYVKKEYYTTSNTFVKYKTAKIDGNYEETMYMRRSDVLDMAAKESREFYNKVCADIKDCLDAGAWTIENDGVPGEVFPTADLFAHSASTHFIHKGASRNQELKSFKVTWYSPFAKRNSKRSSSMYEVQLVFN